MYNLKDPQSVNYFINNIRLPNSNKTRRKYIRYNLRSLFINHDYNNMLSLTLLTEQILEDMNLKHDIIVAVMKQVHYMKNKYYNKDTTVSSVSLREQKIHNQPSYDHEFPPLPMIPKLEVQNPDPVPVSSMKQKIYNQPSYDPEFPLLSTIPELEILNFDSVPIPHIDLKAQPKVVHKYAHVLIEQHFVQIAPDLEKIFYAEMSELGIAKCKYAFASPKYDTIDAWKKLCPMDLIEKNIPAPTASILYTNIQTVPYFVQPTIFEFMANILGHLPGHIAIYYHGILQSNMFCYAETMHLLDSMVLINMGIHKNHVNDILTKIKNMPLLVHQPVRGLMRRRLAFLDSNAIIHEMYTKKWCQEKFTEPLDLKEMNEHWMNKPWCPRGCYLLLLHMQSFDIQPLEI